MAATKRATGARKAPARKPASKPRAAKASAAVAAPAIARPASAGVELICIAKGSRTFGSASGRRYRVVEGEHFTIDAGTAKLLLKSDPDAFVRADQAEFVAETAPTGPVTVADLPDGAKVSKPEEAATSETPAPSSSTTPVTDAAQGAASSGDGDQGGNEPADDPDAAATGEAGTPPSSEAPAAGEPGAEVLS